jgi:hypothetical protein
MIGRDEADQPIGPQARCVDARIGGLLRRYRDVGRVARHLVEHVGRVADGEGEGEPRMGRLEPRQHGHDVAHAVSREPKMAAGQRLGAGQEIGGLVLGGHQGCRDHEQALAERRQPHRASDAVEQAHPVSPFEGSDLSGERRLADPSRPRRPREALGNRDCVESPKAGERGCRHV